jgi:uncharacterized protein (TIGR02271 family)
MTTPDQTVPVTEERLRVEKRDVASGRVRVETRTETVEEIVRISLGSDLVEIRRVPIGREVASPPPVRTEVDITIVPILEEVVVVQRRLVLKEEVHLVRRVQSETLEVPVELRKQHAVVSRLDRDGQITKDE